MRYALEVATENDKPSAALRAYYNLADSLARLDRFEESVSAVRDGIALARRVGNRYWEWSFAAQGYPFFALGLWDEVVALREGLPEDDWTQARLSFAGLPTSLVPVYVHRGQVDKAEELMTMLAELATSDDVQERIQFKSGMARLQLVRGRPAEALSAAEEVVSERDSIGISSESIKEALVAGVEAALAFDNVERAEQLIAIVDALRPAARRSSCRPTRRASVL
jgi:Tetratricopeptide repeat